MRVIYGDMTLYNFDAWSGAVSTKETIINAGKVDEFDALIDEFYPEGLTDTELNDLLWFDWKWIYESLGMSEDEEDEEDEED